MLKQIMSCACCDQNAASAYVDCDAIYPDKGPSITFSITSESVTSLLTSSLDYTTYIAFNTWFVSLAKKDNSYETKQLLNKDLALEPAPFF